MHLPALAVAFFSGCWQSASEKSWILIEDLTVGAVEANWTTEARMRVYMVCEGEWMDDHYGEECVAIILLQ